MKRFFAILALALAFAACKKEDGPQPGPQPTPTGDITVSGVVRGTDGKGIAGVVVSDGLNCVKTDADGMYKLPADLATAKYVILSLPSDYTAPVYYGLPVFYKRLSEQKKTGDVYTNVDFELYKSNSPERYTVIFTADPQPRATGATYDGIAYRSLDCCDDMYRDLKELKATINNRPVFGISLGDIVHENANLYTKYKNGLSTLGYPTFNVIGNHDHTYSAEDCSDEYEAEFGPTNYSFNIGGIHYIVLDNMIMQYDDESKKYKKVTDGITDSTWEWLKNDLSFVSKDTPLMVCAHSPMVRFNNNERSGKHYADCRALFQTYNKVYQWSGHTHSSYNHVDKSNPVIESHVLSRTTGELWTNEYIGANGTPRGYVIMEVNGKDVSWKFKPIIYQKGSFKGSKKPSYTYRDWNYDDSGVAVLKSDGTTLSGDYQMHVYAPGTYGDGYLYVNVFLWDELWNLPVLTVDGQQYTLSRVTSAQAAYQYDLSNKEIRSFYKANSVLKSDSNYGASPEQCFSMFRAFIDKEHASGTVSVKDRFGNTYKSIITW